MNQADRDRIEDLGLDPDADKTEDMRTAREPRTLARPARADQEHPSNR